MTARDAPSGITLDLDAIEVAAVEAALFHAERHALDEMRKARDAGARDRARGQLRIAERAHLLQRRISALQAEALTCRRRPRLALPWWLWPAWIAALGVWGWDLGRGVGGWTLALDAIPAALLLVVAALWGGRRA